MEKSSDMDRNTRIRVFLLGWMGDTSVIMSIIIKYN